MDAFYIFNSILGCLPKEKSVKNIYSEFYVGGNLIKCVTNNHNSNYSKSVLTSGKYKYAYIFRDTTPSERDVRKFIISEHIEEDYDGEVEDIQR